MARSNRIFQFPGGSWRVARSQPAKRGMWLRLMATPWEPLAVLFTMVCTLYVGAVYLERSPDLLAPRAGQTVVESVHFPMCVGATRFTCVVDGDTIWLRGEKIRIADIDTPEISSPECSREYALGQQATARLAQLLNQGPIAIVPYSGRDEDVYGRKLRIIERDGASIGQMLVAEGLARKWDGARRGWCA